MVRSANKLRYRKADRLGVERQDLELGEGSVVYEAGKSILLHMIETACCCLPVLHHQEEVNVQLSMVNDFRSGIAMGLIAIIAGVREKDFEP